MKKGLVIAGAVILVLLLIALWVYVMFFGTPRELPVVFDGFGGGGTTSVTVETPTEASITPTAVAVEKPPLRQLTTKPVVGYREIAPTGSSSPRVHYVEAGTGHIYEVDTKTGSEHRRSGTTIPEAVKAAFSADGQMVVIKSGYQRGGKTVLGTFGSSSDSLSLTEITDVVDQFTVVGSSTLLYTVKGTVLTAKALDLKTRATRTLFTLPFRDATVAWGSSADATHIAYPKPSYLLPGYVYSIRAGTLTRLPISGFGLSAFISGDIVGASWVENNQYQSTFYSLSTKDYSPTGTTYLPEKCTAGNNPTTLWCVSFQSGTSFGFPDTWHRGEITLDDTLSLLRFTATTTSIQNLSTFAEESGRSVDAINLLSGHSDRAVYFVNRLDNSLWLYELD